MASETPMVPCVFEWDPSINSELYEIEGGTCKFKAHGTAYYRPVVSKTVMQPNTGKHFWELLINVDNMRVGVAVDGRADLGGEMGKAAGLASVNLQNDACEIDGVEYKRLWRVVVPVSGGLLGFCWDSDEGTLQLWFNGEYIGMAFNADAGLKGKAVRPCVGIQGIEANNRNIGVGMKSAVVVPNPRVPKAVQ